MHHQLTNNLELELRLDGTELLQMLTTTKHLGGSFGGAYRFEEIATHGWHLGDVEAGGILDNDVIAVFTLVRAEPIESGNIGT